MNIDLKPCVIAATEAYDYDVRAEALRIIRCGEVDLTHPKLREVVMCVSSMAFAGLLEYYGGWDFEMAGLTLVRESSLADDLARIEAKLLPKHEGTPEELKSEMKAQEAEIRAVMEAVDVERARPRPVPLPPGTPISLRGLALLRQREREED
jgi:hypothetical protein